MATQKPEFKVLKFESNTGESPKRIISGLGDMEGIQMIGGFIVDQDGCIGAFNSEGNHLILLACLDIVKQQFMNGFGTEE